MAETPKQLAFDLPLDPRYGREDFLVSPSNDEAYSLIERWPDWPDKVLHLTGPEGSGKSHLAAIWATLHEQAFRRLGQGFADCHWISDRRSAWSWAISASMISSISPSITRSSL